MILEDCVMLARTVPEPSKKYGTKVCSVVYSPELQNLIRIYPLMLSDKILQRQVFRVKLIRNKFDSRNESFKKVAYSLTDKFVDKEKLRLIFDKLKTSDICNLNFCRASLGIIKAEMGEYYLMMKSKKDVKDTSQLCLFEIPNYSDSTFLTAKDYKHIPYVVIPSQKHQKNIQLRDWGIYRLMAKYDGIVSNEQLYEIFEGFDIYFIVGNMNHCRNVWIGCSFYRYKVSDQLQLF